MEFSSVLGEVVERVWEGVGRTHYHRAGLELTGLLRRTVENTTITLSQVRLTLLVLGESMLWFLEIHVQCMYYV